MLEPTIRQALLVIAVVAVGVMGLFARNILVRAGLFILAFPGLAAAVLLLIGFGSPERFHPLEHDGWILLLLLLWPAIGLTIGIIIGGHENRANDT